MGGRIIRCGLLLVCALLVALPQVRGDGGSDAASTQSAESPIPINIASVKEEDTTGQEVAAGQNVPRALKTEEQKDEAAAKKKQEEEAAASAEAAAKKKQEEEEAAAATAAEAAAKKKQEEEAAAAAAKKKQEEEAAAAAAKKKQEEEAAAAAAKKKKEEEEAAAAAAAAKKKKEEEEAAAAAAAAKKKQEEEEAAAAAAAAKKKEEEEKAAAAEKEEEMNFQHVLNTKIIPELKARCSTFPAWTSTQVERCLSFAEDGIEYDPLIFDLDDDDFAFDYGRSITADARAGSLPSLSQVSFMIAAIVLFFQYLPKLRKSRIFNRILLKARMAIMTKDPSAHMR